MKHMEDRFPENCRTYVHDKPVTSLSIAVALGRQDAGRDKVAGFMTGKLMRPQRPQTPVGKPEPQAKTPTPLEEALNLLTLAQNVSSAWSWVPMMNVGRPAPAAGFVPHRSPVMECRPLLASVLGRCQVVKPHAYEHNRFF
jgi:hypothetical protein